MVKVKIKASQESFDSRTEDRGEFVLPKPGYYVLTVVGCDPGNTKNKETGEPDPKKPHLKFTYRITGVGPEDQPVTENYGYIFDYLTFSEGHDGKRAETLFAFGIANEGGEFDVDTDDLVNRKVLARVKHEKGQTKDDPKQPKVARLMPYGSDISSGGPDVDYGNDEDDVFGGEAEQPGDVDAGDVPKYSRDDLEAMDLKGLGAILKEEFDGDPKACIVRDDDGKVDATSTKASVIDNIWFLMTGEQPSEADSGSADDDPF